MPKKYLITSDERPATNLWKLPENRWKSSGKRWKTTVNELKLGENAVKSAYPEYLF
jgi:hypothetical protein